MLPNPFQSQYEPYLLTKEKRKKANFSEFSLVIGISHNLFRHQLIAKYANKVYALHSNSQWRSNQKCAEIEISFAEFGGLVESLVMYNIGCCAMFQKNFHDSFTERLQQLPESSDDCVYKMK